MNDPFLHTVLEDPQDKQRLLVYADWLEEQGDERAEYLRLQWEYAGNPTDETRRKLRERYPQRHIPWTALLEQAGAVTANLTQYEFGWWGTGIGPARETNSTFELFAYHEQPPVPVERFDGSFAWLKDSPDENGHESADAWKTTCGELRRQGWYVPPVFERFMTDPHLPGRIKSCTDNYFTAASPEEIVERDDGLFVTFYADSQYCVVWGLLLPREPGRYAPVLAGGPYSFFSNWQEDLDEPPPPPALAASNLETFLYRWWIENEIWYATVWDETLRPLTPEEQAYVDHLSRPR